MRRSLAVALTLPLLLNACTQRAPRSAGPAETPHAPGAPTPSPEASSGDVPSLEPPRSATPEPSPSETRAAPRGVVPTGFAATGVTFTSSRTGWFLGTGRCGTTACRALLRTRDTGRTFTALSAPPATEVRFADALNGWAFTATLPRSGLWRTHDGGSHWRRIGDRAVASLEIARGTVWSVVLGEDGTAPELYRGSTQSDTSTRVTGIGNRSGYVVVSGRTAFAVGVQGAGPIAPDLTVVDSAGVHHPGPPPCGKNANYTNDFDLAAITESRVVAVCYGEPGVGNQFKAAFTSTDAARHWTRLPDPSQGGYTFGKGNLAATSMATLLTGSRSGIELLPSGGSWRTVLESDDDGFEYVGMTDTEHGVALETSSAWLTADGGYHWHRVRFG